MDLLTDFIEKKIAEALHTNTGSRPDDSRASKPLPKRESGVTNEELTTILATERRIGQIEAFREAATMIDGASGARKLLAKADHLARGEQ